MTPIRFMTVLIFCLGTLASASTDAVGWEPFEEVDPITDIVRVGATIDNLVVWCEPSSWWDGGLHLEVVIKTNNPPEAYIDNYGEGVGLPELSSINVPFEYRFDKTKGERFDAWVAEDYQGVRICTGSLKHCTKTFTQKMYSASSLTYRVDTLVGGSETSTISFTGGKEHLRRVMDECKIKPKSFKGIGN